MATKFDAIIKRLWQTDEDRAVARGFVDRFASMPGMEDRIPAMLQEAAATADKIDSGEISLDDGRGYLASFASEALGTPPHLMTELTTWFDSQGEPTEQPAAEPDKPAPEQPPAQISQAQQPLPAPPAAAPAPPATAPVRPAGPSREQLQAEVAKWENAMRSPEKSEPWRDYWQRGGSQQYAAALQALEAADAAPPPAQPAPSEGAS